MRHHPRRRHGPHRLPRTGAAAAALALLAAGCAGAGGTSFGEATPSTS